VWVEAVLALIVEGYREFVYWLPSRALVRTSAPAVPAVRLVERVNAILDRHARRHVGVALGVWRQGEIWTFARGRLGAKSSTPPGPDTIFEIGSVTKVFTATVLADMVEEGLVALGDPVQRYLPDDARLPVRGRPITLADLATQTSGLPRLPRGLILQSFRHRQDPYARFTVADLERAVGEARLKGEPGGKIRYSNFGFGLLGHVLAARSGRTFERLVQERICEPLGLTDTRITIPPEARARLADGHNRRGRTVAHWELPALAGAGALRSTVADLLGFLELQFRQPGTRLERAAQATHEPRAHRGPLVQCLGWVELPLRGGDRRVLWHNGGTGGFRSFVGLVKESETGVVVLSNSSRSVDAIGFRVLEALDERDVS